jgi:hypothetical protein
VIRGARFTLVAAAAALAFAACGGDSDDKGADASAPPADAMPPPPDAAPPDAPPQPDAGSDPCGGVSAHCLDSTTLEVCENGALVPTDCGAQSQICQADGAGSFECADPPVPGANTVSGKAQYEDRVPQPDGSLADIRSQPVRGATVSVVQDTGSAVLATGRTADDGTYSLSYDAPAGTMVHVLVATTSDLASRPVKVVKKAPSNVVHGLAGPSFASAVGVTQNLLAKESASLGQAFNVFDQMITGIDTVRARMGAASLSPIVTHWQINSDDGTYYNGSINLLGGPDDDDGYDDAVILHEFGHYVEAIYGKSSSPGGGHGGEAVDPRLGWSEGFSTYFSSAARGNQFYMDSNANGGFGDDLENALVKYSGTNMTGLMSEETVAEVLWDIGDGQASDDDPRGGGDRHEDVMKVQIEYLHSGVTATRGVSGIDLVDFLDGWFKLRGTSTCTALRTIIATTHTFPYDFAASGAACP